MTSSVNAIGSFIVGLSLAQDSYKKLLREGERPFKQERKLLTALHSLKEEMWSK